VRIRTVKGLSLSLVLIAFAGSVLGCERELPYQAPPETPITGYRIEGYVTDRLGIPLKGVRVAAWYDYDFVDTVRPPSTSFLVDDSTKRVLIRVLDHNSIVRAVLFDGRSATGLLKVEWNKRDAFGYAVPSGVYTVDFSMNGVSRASYPIVVDGAVTTATDSLGHYVIPDENLPIGFYPVPRYSSYDSHFIGNYRITNLIALELYLDPHRGISLSVTKDQVTRRDIIF
jgi:hypothetical protein